ncbi:hypothetical protein AG1IA_03282 [Rhizoctonia solani AG-1 IA]|uniref:Uncharacterized protein n=1 Tax=Thanatephorus cucumeris (strain AG1-IA) TaxID=983506 RepID=L8X0Y1_THACA|nr:hypothetical protein AG1IA_03282 [Rhizoctonia solani AG-1 IA]
MYTHAHPRTPTTNIFGCSSSFYSPFAELFFFCHFVLPSEFEGCAVGATAIDYCKVDIISAYIYIAHLVVVMSCKTTCSKLIWKAQR